MRTNKDLYNYQKRIIKQAVLQERLAIFAGVGCGKTSISLYILYSLFKTGKITKALILAPKKVALTSWTDEMVKWDIGKYLKAKTKVITGLKKAKRNKILDEDNIIIIANHDVIGSIFEENTRGFDCIIVDESSVYKNHKGRGSKILQEVSRHTPYMYLLSGTPAPNDYHDFWAQVYMIDNGYRLGKTISKFRDKWCYKADEYWNYKFDLSKKEAFVHLLDEVSVFLKASDKLELPPIVVKDISFDLPVEVSDYYREMLTHNIVSRDGKVSKKDNTLKIDKKNVPAVSEAIKFEKLLQISSGFVYDDKGEKLNLHDERIEIIKDLILKSGNVIIVYNYNHELEVLTKTFPQAVNIKHTTPEEWNKGHISILLLHPASAGHGLNLQFGGSHIIFYSLKYSLEYYEQVIGRLHRVGIKDSVTITRIKMIPIQIGKRYHSIDERIFRVLDEKEINQKSVFDILKLERDD